MASPRFQVTNFPHHDDVRGLPEHGPQGGRKGHPHVRPHLHLIDPGYLVLNRIFHGDDLSVGLVDGVQSGIKRGRLAGTGGSCNQKNAIRHRYDSLERFLIVGKETKLRQPQAQAFLVEYTHDDTLTMNGGQSGNPQINHLLPYLDVDPSIQRNPFFGQTYVRHKLGAGNNGRLEAFGGIGLFLQFAVHPETDTEFFLQGLHVNVGSPPIQGILDHRMSVLDDGASSSLKSSVGRRLDLGHLRSCLRRSIHLRSSAAYRLGLWLRAPLPGRRPSG